MKWNHNVNIFLCKNFCVKRCRSSYLTREYYDRDKVRGITISILGPNSTEDRWSKPCQNFILNIQIGFRGRDFLPVAIIFPSKVINSLIISDVTKL